MTRIKVSKKRRAKPALAEMLVPKQDKRSGEIRSPSSFTSLSKSVLAKISGKTKQSKDRRHQQLKELSGTNEIELSEVEKKINRNLALSLSSLGLITTGSLLFPPLRLLGLVPLTLAVFPLLQRTYNLVTKEKKIGVPLVESISIAGTLGMGAFFPASLLLTIIYFSQKLIVKTEDHANQKLTNIFGEQARFVWIRLDDNAEIEIPIEQLEVSHTVVINAGQTIPIDGLIIEGVATVDQHVLTGESQPVEKGIDQEVFASTFILSGRIYIQVQKTGNETVAAQIGDILSHTADFKSSVQSRGEKIINRGATPTLALSALALPFLGPYSALSVLFSSFGYHMQLAAPISVLNFLNIVSEKGILVKDGRALELLSEVDTIVFDKTGTLTEEVPTVKSIYTCHQYGQNQLLAFTAAVESKQSHPIAQAIIHEAHQRKLRLPSIHDAEYEVGYGLKVRIEETGLEDGSALIRVGSGRFMAMEGIEIPAGIEQLRDQCHAEGHTLVYVAINDQLGGAIELVPTIRPEAKAIISELRQRNIDMFIISGDHQQPTQKLAHFIGIDHYFAEVLPQDKASLIEQLQQEGRSVCFIGDGINDSIALKKANVSISMRGASTAATDTAAIILMDGTLNKLVPLLNIAKDLDRNLTTSTIMTVLPGVICVGGVFFLHFGLISAITMYSVGLLASVSNAMLPRLKYQ